MTAIGSEWLLPAAAAVEAASRVAATVESAIAMEVNATVETNVAVGASIALKATAEAFMPIEAAAIVAVPVVATAPIAVIPGAGADEDAVHEVTRAVVAVGGAGVRIVAVIAIGTDWSGTHDGGANGDADTDLRMG